MPRIDQNKLTKLYYSIGEVADMFDVNTSLIRFWEKEFPSVKPKKNKKGNRLFSPKEIVKIDLIYSLVKDQGYTLDGAKKALKSNGSTITEMETNTTTQLISRLEKIKTKLIQLKD